MFYFLLGIFACGAVGVYAQTYFPSNNVTYENKNSGLESTNVQGAIDELYNTCQNPPVASDSLIDKTVTSGDGLYQDTYESGRYIFKGINPNNYITFNGEMAGWRIISVESDKTIKIMRIANLGVRAWNSRQWAYWEDNASLNTYLNETYYNSLTATAQNQIVAHNWSIGTVTDDNNNLSSQISSENGRKWYGKIALPTVSEYIRTNSNPSMCGTLTLYNDNYNSCKNTTWMYVQDNHWWTLSQESGTEVFYATGSACWPGKISITTTDTTNECGVSIGPRPVVYLSPSITLKGSGSQQDPYTIE